MTYFLEQHNRSKFSISSNSTSFTQNILKVKEVNASTPTAFPDMLTLNWQRAMAVSFFLLLILITIVGNTLVILSVITTRRLRTVTNCFVMNLAVADWLVGMFVMPPAVIYYVIGAWNFGRILCDVWISLDVLLCTASILSLCAISLDRYLAVIQPLTYSKRRRSKRLASLMILVVWIVALIITCPPFFGWYEAERGRNGWTDCRYNQNKGYVIFSAMGSFFIPLAVMLYVYMRIGCVLTTRRQRITESEAMEKSANGELETFHSESENMHNNSPKHKLYGNFCKLNLERNISQNTLYELLEISKSTSTIRCSTISCNKFHEQHNLKPIQSYHCCESRASISESCLSSGKIKMAQSKFPMRISTLKRETKTAKTLTTVMGGFIVCWLPFFIYYLLIPFLPKTAVIESLMSALTWLGWISCAINPFIYAFYNSDFRTAFWRLTFRRMCKKPNNLMAFKN